MQLQHKKKVCIAAVTVISHNRFVQRFHRAIAAVHKFSCWQSSLAMLKTMLPSLPR